MNNNDTKAKIEYALDLMRTAWSAIVEARRAARNDTTLPTQAIESILDKLQVGAARIDSAANPLTISLVIIDRVGRTPDSGGASVFVPKPAPTARTPDAVLKAREEAYRDG